MDKTTQTILILAGLAVVALVMWKTLKPAPAPVAPKQDNSLAGLAGIGTLVGTVASFL